MSDNRRTKPRISRDERRRNWQLFMQDVRYNLRNSSFQSKVVAFGKLLILLFILIGIPIIMAVTMKDSLLSTEYWASLPDRLGDHKILSFIILTLLQTAQIVISVLPGEPIQLAASYLYGLWGGYAICILGSTFGIIITYHLAKFLGSDALRIVFGEDKIHDLVHKLNSPKAYTIIFLLYLIPLVPKDLVSYVAGISDIRLRPFVIVATLGRSPVLLGNLLIGQYLRDQNYVGVAITVLIFAVLLFLCWKFKDVIMAKISSFEEEYDKK
ncbi:MAG: VTT domain-containing protein [Mogibacterium sp.]|nr:VTT domain-containing protein [Mogibacterium sp.]